jgi:predicted nucleic acid-binding Zn ribbon protein
VGDLLVSAIPQLAERLVEHRLRRAWTSLVGADVARRAQPHSLSGGCLHVVVDNSPWLHELTLRGAELTDRLRAHAPAVRSVRFTLGRLPDVDVPAPAPVAAAAPLTPADVAEIDAAAAAIKDDALATAARRLLAKAWRSHSTRGPAR